MCQRIKACLRFVRTSVLAILGGALVFAFGCAQPIGLRVLDSTTGAPVSNADVTRSTVLRPYFIVGPIAPVEHSKTDAEGFARLKDREGTLEINAPGFTSKYVNMPEQTEQIVVKLVRADDGDQPSP
jgi:hypothetical protein